MDISSRSLIKTAAATETVSAHKLELDRHRALSMTGVKAVPVFTDKNMTVKLDEGSLLITGRGLSVKHLDVEGGKLLINGDVTSLRYTDQASPTSFVKKIFR